MLSLIYYETMLGFDISHLQHLFFYIKEERRKQTENGNGGDRRCKRTHHERCQCFRRYIYHNIYDVLQANYEGNRNSQPDVDFEETKL